MVAVRGILLNELVLFAEDNEGNLGFQSGGQALLRRLKYSNLRVGICYAAGVSTQKMAFLRSTATLYLVDYFMWNASSVDDAVNEVLQSWGDVRGSCIYVTTCEDEDFSLKISNHGWFPVVKRTAGVSTTENSKLLLINKLEELPLTICHFNRKYILEFEASHQSKRGSLGVGDESYLRSKEIVERGTVRELDGSLYLSFVCYFI